VRDEMRNETRLWTCRKVIHGEIVAIVVSRRRVIVFLAKVMLNTIRTQKVFVISTIWLVTIRSWRRSARSNCRGCNFRPGRKWTGLWVCLGLGWYDWRHTRSD
jgi:hypothetical protein